MGGMNLTSLVARRWLAIGVILVGVALGCWATAQWDWIRQEVFWRQRDYDALLPLLEKQEESQRDARWYFRYLTAQQAVMDSAAFEAWWPRLGERDARAAEGIGDFWMQQGRWELAARSYRLADGHSSSYIQQRLRTLQAIREGIQLIRKGNFCYNRGMLDSATIYYRRAVDRLVTTPAELSAYRARYNLIMAQAAAGRLSRPAAAYQRLYRELRGKGYIRMEINLLNNLGILAKRRGEFDRARAYYREALTLAKKVGDIDAQLMIGINLGTQSLDEGNLTTAELELRQVLTLMQKVGEEGRYRANALWNLAMIDYYRGYYRSALQKVKTALQWDHQYRDTIGLCYDYFGMGKIYWGMGLWDESLENLNRSLDLQERTRYAWLKASTLGQIGMVYKQMGLYVQAEERLLEALKIDQRVDDKLSQIQTLFQLVDLYRQIGQLHKAQRYLNRFHRLMLTTGYHLGEVEWWLYKGQLAFSLQQNDSAYYYLNRLLKEFTGATYVKNRTKALLLLGQLAMRQGNGVLAREYGEQALRLVQSHNVAMLLFEVYSFLAEVYRKTGDHERAREIFWAGQNWVSAYATYLTVSPSPDEPFQEMRDFYKKHVRFWYRQGELGKAMAVYWRNTSLLHWQPPPKEADSRTPGRELRELNHRLSTLHRLMNEPDLTEAGKATIRKKLSEVQERLEEQWAYLRMQASSHAVKRLFPEDMAAVIPELSAERMNESALVIPLIYPDTLIYLLKTRTREYALGIPIKEQAFHQFTKFMVALIEEEIQRPSSGLLREHLLRYYNRWIRPVDEWLQEQGVRRLWVALEDGAAMLPWYMIFDGNAYLTQKYRIAYLLPEMAKSLDDTSSGVRISPAETTLLGMAPFPEEMTASLNEVLAVAARFPGKHFVAIGPEATEAFFKQHLPSAGVVHLATHAQLSTYQPIFSYLQFRADETNDGRVYLFELESLPLQATFVNISACQVINVYKTRAASGFLLPFNFAVQFLKQGAKNVLASPFYLPDQFAAQFSQYLYGQLQRYSVGEAFQNTQEYFIQQGISPAWWGNYFWLTHFHRETAAEIG